MSSEKESETTSATVAKITCGDLVIHPTKPWPWIGTVHPKVGNFARLCTSCGGLRVPNSVRRDGNTQYKLCLESEEGPVPLCESEHEDTPGVQCIGGVGINGGRCLGNCIEDDDEDRMSHDDLSRATPPLKIGAPNISGPFGFAPAPHFRDDMLPPPLVALSVEGALPGRHFQVNWFPSGEIADMDGNEKVIVHFKQRSLYQEGSPVAREGALNDQGLVKQVRRNVDAFVLPDYGWIIQDLPASKLKPLMEIEQCPGCFVIYNGWVGTVYNVWYRFTFRMEDGTEFVLTDDHGEISVHMREENRKAPCADINQMYPGLKMKLRWMLLEHAKWPEGYEIPAEIRAKITNSRDRWNSTESMIFGHVSTPFATRIVPNPDAAQATTAADVATQTCDIQNRTTAGNNHIDEIVDNIVDTVAEACAKKLDVQVPPTAKRELDFANSMAAEAQWNAAHMRLAKSDAATEDMAVVTVVKMEPLKLDVEWLSQVVADIPAGPKGNVIEGDAIKNIRIFRSSRFFEPFDLGVRYRYVIEPGDNLIPSDEWRHLVAQSGDNLIGDQSITELPPRPSPGDSVFVAIARSSSKIDILWENGQFETGVNPEELVAQYSNQTERDYFPAMYVTFQSESGKHHAHNKGHYHRGKSDSGMDDSSQTTRTSSGETAIDSSLIASHSSSSTQNTLPSKFGVVKKAKNSEKYATVAWYEMKKPKQNGDDDEPIFVNEEDVSFYDLKFYYEFNYVGGTLVSRIDTSTLPPGVPNVGYVLRKNPDASVQVVWYDGEEETTRPWKLRQLTTRYDSEYTASDMEEEQHYYSPTEHEYEDLEDFRYYDYTTLSEEARRKRIGLIVAVMREVILRLCKLTQTLDNYFPYVDRKKVVKLTLSCNDVCNGFANLPDFRETLKEMFDVEQKSIDNTASNGQTGDGAVAAAPPPSKMKLLKGRFFREERLVWQCANWLYDWTEAMTTLQEDMRKYRNKIMRKEQQPSSQDAGTPMDTSTPTTAVISDAPKSTIENSQDAAHLKLCGFVADLQSSIEAGLSAITGILSVPPTSDVSSGIVVDFLNGLPHIFEFDEGKSIDSGKSGLNPGKSGMDPESVISTMDTTEKAETVKPTFTIDEFATFASSHKFLRTLVENPSKVGRLPCFSYTHHSELELSALYKQWPQSQFAPLSENSIGAFPMDERSDFVGEGQTPKSCEELVDSVGRLIDDVLHGRRDISYTDDNVLKLCNETADALCLSVLSIMSRIIESIFQKLRPQIEASLTVDEQNQSNMDGDEGKSILDMDHDADQSMMNGDREMTNGEMKKIRNLANGFVPSTPAGHSVVFELLSTAPISHRFISKQFDPAMMPKTFLSAVRKEIKLLHSSLPPGIFVKGYEDRMDLFSCMIIGPQGTPYADGVFFFDVRLKDDYPTRPPHLFYKSMSKLLNPNLYEDGMVCLSLLGTWDGKETELWTSNSNLLQVFVSIQSLILVSEPYYNEPGFEKEKGSSSGSTKSRDYNEAAVLRTLESLQRALNDPPEPFRNELRQHITENSQRLLHLLEKYQDPKGDNIDLSFPLFPVTQGFCLCIKRHAENLLRLAEKWTTMEM